MAEPDQIQTLCGALRYNALKPHVDPTLKPALMRETLALWRDVQVFRYSYKDWAYLDLIRVSIGARPDFTQWRLGDGFDKSFYAYRATTNDNRAFFYIHTLYVAEGYRRNRLGTNLVKEVVGELRLLQRPSIWLCSMPGIATQQSQRELYTFYEHLGFRRIHVDSRIMHFDEAFALPNDRTIDPKVPPDRVGYPEDSSAPQPAAPTPTPGSVEVVWKPKADPLMRVTETEKPAPAAFVGQMGLAGG